MSDGLRELFKKLKEAGHPESAKVKYSISFTVDINLENHLRMLAVLMTINEAIGALCAGQLGVPTEVTTESTSVGDVTFPEGMTRQ